ncbi:hypothetical protein [Spiroplasma alleghenense]|uniref:Transmembrane protein n=1 Tax=Spiroplasma alleghenense TaxID=216931 RepID=A0A345Z4C6_9MOLU|nr:hypothetical protein [Spiroplasma alleghenense]AXK51455.1 hypothetical protein SALLE_v1c07850 [Spiroplasma alleghenense]
MNLLVNYVGNKLDNASALWMGFIVIGITTLLFIILGTYFFKFKKKKVVKSYTNKSLIISVSIVGFLAIALGIVAVILFFNAFTIFPDKPDHAYNVILFGIIFPALGMVIVMFTLMIICAHLFGVAFSENNFELVGELLPYSKIVAVVDDNKTGIVALVYRQGRSNFKSYKFRKSTVVGQFVLENAELTGQKIRVESLALVNSELDAANTTMLASENKADAERVLIKEETINEDAPKSLKDKKVEQTEKALKAKKVEPTEKTAKTTKPKTSTSTVKKTKKEPESEDSK